MEREFKGVWIPAEIWLDKRLTICEKAFLAEVDSFTGNGRTFYKTNETIQEEYGIAPRTVQRMVKKLVSLGLLESSFNGRVRHLSAGRLAKLTGQGRQNDGADSSKWRHTSTKERTKTNTKKKKVVVLPFDSKEFSVAWQSWKDYKRDEHGFKFKSSASEQASLHQLQNLSGGNEEPAVRIIGQSLANGWRGFFPLKNQHNEIRASRGPSDGSLLTAHLRKLANDSGESLG